MFDVIDKIMNLDIGNRGIAHLYEPARARSGGEALCKSAAEVFMKLQPGDTVFLLTGSLTRAWVSPEIGENDGPMGTGALAGAVQGVQVRSDDLHRRISAEENRSHCSNGRPQRSDI